MQGNVQIRRALAQGVSDHPTRQTKIKNNNNNTNSNQTHKSNIRSQKHTPKQSRDKTEQEKQQKK